MFYSTYYGLSLFHCLTNRNSKIKQEVHNEPFYVMLGIIITPIFAALRKARAPTKEQKKYKTYKNKRNQRNHKKIKKRRSTMATSTITVIAVSKDGKSVKVGDQWMKVSNYSKVDPERGKTYEGKISEYKGTKYVSLYKELMEGEKSNGKSGKSSNGKSGKSNDEITRKDRIIARMNALRTAGELMQIKPPEVENFEQVKEVAVETAEQLLKWILMEE